MSDALRVTRIVTVLAGHVEQKVSRAALAQAITTHDAPVDKRCITRLWPRVEAALGRIDLYAIRPAGRADYGVLATRNPLIALMSMTDREKNVVTRLNNDVEGEILERLAAEAGRSSVSAALQLERARVYLDAFRNQRAGQLALHNDAVVEYNALPWATLTAADSIPYED